MNILEIKNQQESTHLYTQNNREKKKELSINLITQMNIHDNGILNK